MRRVFLVLALVVLAASCAGRSAPPRELSGLWSAGPGACDAGIGLRFEESAVAALYAGERETLFANPRYDARRDGDSFEVRIAYDPPGAAPDGGVRGVLVLRRREDGWLTPIAHHMEDPRTGTTRMRIVDDAMALALTVRPCAEPVWIAGLRGRAGG